MCAVRCISEDELWDISVSRARREVASEAPYKEKVWDDLVFLGGVCMVMEIGAVVPLYLIGWNGSGTLLLFGGVFLVTLALVIYGFRHGSLGREHKARVWHRANRIFKELKYKQYQQDDDW